jgi:hypothetical protein
LKFLVLKALEILKVKKNGNKVCCNLSVISAKGSLAPSFEKQIDFFSIFYGWAVITHLWGTDELYFEKKDLEAKLKKKKELRTHLNKKRTCLEKFSFVRPVEDGNYEEELFFSFFLFQMFFFLQFVLAVGGKQPGTQVNTIFEVHKFE